MIEKLEPIKEFDCSDTPQAKMQHHSYHNDCIKKINELVDAVNELQEAFESIHPYLKYKDLNKTPTDPYAEQRKWVGCVCRFWYDNPNDTLLDYLDKIQTGKNGVEYYAKESGDWFPHCEPVKADSDIIYKGE